MVTHVVRLARVGARRAARAALLFALVATAAGAAGVAHAQSKGDEEEKDRIDGGEPFSEEIEVMAMKRRGQHRVDVPLSVQVFSGVELESRMVNDPGDALDLVPGASAGVTGGAGTQRYNFRGTGAMGSAGDLAVGFYIDDAVYSSPGNPFGPAVRFFDLEAIEVLRGPQGTLFGQGAMGGTMIIRTASPDLQRIESRARVMGSGMEDGELAWRADLSANLPLVPRKLGLRLTASREQRPGLAESPDFPGRSNLDDGRDWDYRLKLLYEPFEGLSVRASRWVSNDRSNFSPVYSSVDPPLIAGTGGIEGLTHNKTSLSSLVVDWDLPLGNLRSSSSYTEYDDLYRAGSGFDALINGELIAFLLKIRAVQASSSFNQELTLSSPGSGSWQWIVGASYLDGERTADVTAEISSPPGIPTGLSRSLTESRQLALFGEISRELLGGLVTPLVGLRWYEDRRSFVDRGAVVFAADDVFSTVSPRFNLRLRPSERVQVCFNVAKGFRSGTFNTQNNVEIASLFGLTTAVSIPEATLWSYEINASLRFLGGNLLVEPAVYSNRYEDYPVEAQIANAGVIVSVDRVTAVGADLIVLLETSLPGLRFSFTGNTNRTRPDHPAAAVVAQVPALAAGRQLPYVPQWSGAVTASYDRALRGSLLGFAYLSLTRRGGQIDFITGRKSPVTDDLTLRLGAKTVGDRWSIALFGKNLTDDAGPAVTTGGLQIRADRRTIGVEVTAGIR